MTDKLSLYNGSLMLVGERELSSLTENREPRRLLDSIWDRGAVNTCLEQGQWFFAMRAVQLDYDTDISPAFGFTYGFSKPTDWIITSAMCSDEMFTAPILNYIDEAGYWYANDTPIYVKYVSNDASYGTNYGNWPGSFTRYVEAYLASQIALKITGDANRTQLILGLEKRRLLEAKNRSAMAMPTQLSAQGSWLGARLRNSRRDRGSQNTLLG